jgi:DNA-binding PadR family transcriptional regulator
MTHRSLASGAVLILASLADGDRHGYGIRKDVHARTAGEITIGVTSLYRLLAQLLDEGLVQESPRRPAPELDDERRRYYRLTAAGRRALGAEVRRMERVLAAARPGTAKARPRS